MSQSVALILWILVLFQVKHLVCDFLLQNRYQYANKGIYGHPGGLLHVGIHAAGSLGPVLLATDEWWLAASVIAADAAAHYHIDWLKQQIVKRRALTCEKDALFWVVLGVDQFLHQITYIVIIGVLARAESL